MILYRSADTHTHARTHAHTHTHTPELYVPDTIRIRDVILDVANNSHVRIVAKHFQSLYLQ